MLLSDGVVEAMDAEGHLFGFERVHELLHSEDRPQKWRLPRRISARKTTSA